MTKDNSNKRLRRKVRSAYFISTVSIALVLFLLGTVGYLILGAVSATDRMKENVTVNIMLKDGILEAQRDSLGGELQAMPAVKESVFVPKEQAADEFKKVSGTDFEKFLGVNPLPDGFRLKIKAAWSNSDSLAAFEKNVAAWKGVDEVLYQKGVADQITTNINRFLLILLLFGGTLLIIAVVLLSNTIRVAIYSKRHVINTMKLVGATRGFILRPFAWDAVLQGVYAALIAGVMFVAMLAGMREGLPDLAFILGNRQLIIILGAMLAAGVLISLLFTIFAVNKFINMRTSQIHLY